jgi:GlpG protein
MTWELIPGEVGYSPETMRIIGHLESESFARTFSEYLYVKGIKNQIEAETDGTWAVWIHAEDEIEPARSLLRKYVANPNDAAIRRTAEKARELMNREEEDAEAARKRQFDRDRLFPNGGLAGVGVLTVSLIGVSVIVYLLQEYSGAPRLTDYLYISEQFGKDLPEVRQGQIWRLITPIFLHFHVLHILFNMLWLKDLGSVIETRVGALQLLLLVVAIGIASNLAQYFISGPAFGGMSGVVYGLLGYVWMKSRFDPSSGMFLHPSTVTMMLIWLALGYTNLLPVKMANTVHAVGLAVGMVWGFVSARVR